MTANLYDHGLERTVVAALILDPAIIPSAQVVVQPDMFGDPFNREALEAVFALYNAAQPIEWATVARQMLVIEHDLSKQDLAFAKGLKRQAIPTGPNEQDRLEHYQRQLSEACASVASGISEQYVLTMAGQLRELWVGRKLSAFALSVERQFQNPGTRTPEVLDKIERAVHEMRGEAGHSRLRRIAEDAEVVVQDHAARKQLRLNAGANADAVLPGLASGFPDLDLYSTGWKPGELVVIGARPGIGKTSLALNIAAHVAQHNEGGVLLFSLEMTGHELAFRLACAVAGVDQQHAKLGKLSDEDELRLEDAVEAIRALPLYIDDTPGLGMREIRAKAAVARQRYGVELVMLDYLQRIRNPSFRTPRWEHVGNCAKGLKTLARETEIPVVALAQLNRNMKQRRGASAKPALEDLRESGDIEQEADSVYLLSLTGPYRKPWEPKPTLERARAVVMELDIQKNRSGPNATVSLLFQRWCGKWETFSEELRHEWNNIDKPEKPIAQPSGWQDGSKAREENRAEDGKA